MMRIKTIKDHIPKHQPKQRQQCPHTQCLMKSFALATALLSDPTVSFKPNIFDMDHVNAVTSIITSSGEGHVGERKGQVINGLARRGISVPYKFHHDVIGEGEEIKRPQGNGVIGTALSQSIRTDSAGNTAAPFGPELLLSSLEGGGINEYHYIRLKGGGWGGEDGDDGDDDDDDSDGSRIVSFLKREKEAVILLGGVIFTFIMGMLIKLTFIIQPVPPTSLPTSIKQNKEEGEEELARQMEEEELMPVKERISGDDKGVDSTIMNDFMTLMSVSLPILLKGFRYK